VASAIKRSGRADKRALTTSFPSRAVVDMNLRTCKRLTVDATTPRGIAEAASSCVSRANARKRNAKTRRSRAW
jgi:hypothetical protein